VDSLSNHTIARPPRQLSTRGKTKSTGCN
jgi:hypothetical protein